MAEIFLDEKKPVKVYRVMCPKCGVYYAGYRNKPKPKNYFAFRGAVQCLRCKEAIDISLSYEFDSYIRPPFYWTGKGELKGLISKWTLFKTDFEKVEGLFIQEGTLERQTYDLLMELNDFVGAMSKADDITVRHINSIRERAETLQNKILEIFGTSFPE